MRRSVLIVVLCLAGCGSRGSPAAPAATQPACSADLTSDPLNCGACGRRCPSAERTLPVCVEGQCRHACRVGYLECDGRPGTVCETEVLRDPCNCSRCAQRCPAGEFCVAGQCQPRQDTLVHAGPPAPASCKGWHMPPDGR